jgi:deoxyribonuclease V
MHKWKVSVKTARKIQLRLRDKVIRRRNFSKIRTIAAADVAFKGGWVAGVVAVFSFPQLELLEVSYRKEKASFPYVPGFLTFREGPVLMKVFKALTIKPDLILFDGQGIAHPLRFGEASHLGVLLDKPSIGCAKSRFIGEYKEPGKRRGSFSFLFDGQDKIGAAVRTRNGVKPIFVSIGHRIDLENAIKIVLACSKGYRIPEPLRLAHSKSLEILKAL